MELCFRCDHTRCTRQIRLPPNVGALCACPPCDMLGAVAPLMQLIAGLVSALGYILKEDFLTFLFFLNAFESHS